tara:strand:- start:3808 stop:4674 length:867 start_codon:yes stop_codon:yes gene_type:complete
LIFPEGKISLTVLDLVKVGKNLLRRSTNSWLDSELLVSHVCDCDRVAIYRDPDTLVTPRQYRHFIELANARARGQPVAQLLGLTYFWSLSFVVDANVLIPRPETETLIETALELIPSTGHYAIADLGTGSGAIAVALALERAQAMVIATDVSSLALDVAERNRCFHKASQLFLLRGDWMAALGTKKLDFIVSNPPYVESNDSLLQDSDIRFEPRQALASGKDGLDDLRAIIKQAPERLKPDGFLLVEHGYNQGLRVRQLFAERGFQKITTRRDLGKLERVTFGQRVCQ